MPTFRVSPLPELWGGVECSVVRVGDEYVDQLEKNGHSRRLEDLDRFAGIGIRALRHPVLWERTAPNSPERLDWKWNDASLARLRALGVRTIAGLVHHGSGPRYTSLIDPLFPQKLARYAGEVARRYPWLDAYTPINEPLTTARFCGLYGHWYPHGHDETTFVRALLTQCRGVVLAMRAIREVNPRAQLIQTEDLGRVSSTKPLAYQADFENERRWLTWDILSGRVDPSHPMWTWLRSVGASEADLLFHVAHPMPPDVVGVNHYATSNRFLDHRLDRYPERTHGGNGRDRYADVAAVRVDHADAIGPGPLLREAWDRYALPIAITEVHLGCTREEQLRWFRQCWEEGVAAAKAGVDMRAVTAWSLLGSFDWDSLLTLQRDSYEPGVFDLRAPTPRPTALVRLLEELAQGGAGRNPVLAQPGWWRRPDRFFIGKGNGDGASSVQKEPIGVLPTGGLLVTGATGTLGKAFSRICAARGIEHRLLSRQDMDIADPASVDRVLDSFQPWAVVNAAGYVRVDQAERERDLCRRENVVGPAVLAAACRRRDIRLVVFSSDLVFDGASPIPYVEEDAVAPLSVYGRSKADAEVRVRNACPEALIIRTSAFFGPWDRHNFVTLALAAFECGRSWACAGDAIVSPTYVPDLVHSTLDLLIDGESGVWHLANQGETSWADLAHTVAELAGERTELVLEQQSSALGFIAPRPRYSVLRSARGALLPPLSDALTRYLQEREHIPEERASAVG